MLQLRQVSCMQAWLRWAHPLLLPLFGAATSCLLLQWLFNAFAFPSLRPVANWMAAHGLGPYVPYYVEFHIRIPGIVLGCGGAAIAGLLGRRRWMSFALLYLVSFFAAPYILQLVDGSLLASATQVGVGVYLVRILYDVLVIIPLALGAAWAGSRPGKRRRDERRAAGLCTACCYDLTGNTSGVCPECGTIIERVVE